MNIVDIQARLRVLSNRLESKGWYCYTGPDCDISTNSVRFSAVLRPPYSTQLHTEWTYEDYIKIKESADVGEHEEALCRFTANVFAVETLADTLHGMWRQKLADLAAEGEELGFALEYVEVLRATAKRLAENALPAPIDDEIPF